MFINTISDSKEVLILYNNLFIQGTTITYMYSALHNSDNTN